MPDVGSDSVLLGFLVTFKDTDKGRFWPLGSGVTVLGRSGAKQAPNIALRDECSSSRHATIQGDPESGVVEVMDAGSTNGTWVNECFVPPGTRRQLVDGDLLRIGATPLVVKLLAG